MSNLLDCFKETAPYIKELTLNDIGITIADTEKYVDFIPCGNTPKLVKPGDIIPKDTIVSECIKTGKRTVKKVPSEVFGFPYIAIGMPIKENNKIIGAISLLVSTDKQENILCISNNISKELKQVSTSSKSINNELGELMQISNELNEISSKSIKYINETDSILNIIQNISRKTNLLGLNASIEAARVGESGKGFEVVASEIRKLAINTSESINKINEILSGIKVTSNEQKELIGNINNIVKTQSESTNDTNNNIEKLYLHFNNLIDHTKNLNIEGK